MGEWMLQAVKYLCVSLCLFYMSVCVLCIKDDERGHGTAETGVEDATWPEVQLVAKCWQNLGGWVCVNLGLHCFILHPPKTQEQQQKLSPCVQLKPVLGLCREQWSSGPMRIHSVLIYVGVLVWHPFSLLIYLAEDCFEDTLEAMVHLSIDSEKQAQIFRVRGMFLGLNAFPRPVVGDVTTSTRESCFYFWGICLCHLSDFSWPPPSRECGLQSTYRWISALWPWGSVKRWFKK